MNFSSPLDNLDRIEEFVIEEMAANGWRLEIKPFTGWPPPDGWQYCSSGMGGRDGKLFRVETISRWWETRSEPAQGEETEQDCRRLEHVMHCLWNAREALNRGDAFAAHTAGSSLETSLQIFDKRRRDRDLRIISKFDRPGARTLPKDSAELQAECAEIAAVKGERFVAGIIAEKYKVTPAAVRKALRKNKSKT